MGFVASTAFVDNTSELFDDSRVEGTSSVTDGSELYGYTVVRGSAQVKNTVLSGGGVTIGGSAKVNNSSIYGAQIYGNALVQNITVSGYGHIFGDAIIFGLDAVNSRLVLAGDCKIGGKARIDLLDLTLKAPGRYGKSHVDVNSQRGLLIITLTDVWDMG